MKIDKRFTEIERLVEVSYHHEDFSLETICTALDVSRSTVHRLISAKTGLSTTGYIKAVRLAKAYDILLREKARIKEVAHRVGFRDPKYFSKMFKQIYGLLPTHMSANLDN